MKIITVCGSLRFEQEMKYYSEKLEMEGNCVLSVIYGTKEKEDYSKEEIEKLQNGHFKRIEISDAIFVANKNGYIGEAVKSEIEFAKKHKKEIIYLEKINEQDNIIYHNKLVRDQIISIIESSGKKVNFEILNDEKFLNELDKKLVEEVTEFIKEKSEEELADIFEVLNKIIEIRGMDTNNIEKIRLKKKSERGGFDKKIFLKYVNEK